MNFLESFKKEYKAHKPRFLVEMTSFCCALTAISTLAFNVPEPPFVFIFSMFLISNVMLITAGIIRQAPFIVLQYIMFFIFESIGLYNAIMGQ
jgi:hypothetical protein